LLQKPEYEISSELNRFKALVEKQGQWEILRELDRFEALKNKDNKKLCQLYFGSPLVSYRNFIESELQWKAPESFVYELGRKSKGRVHYEVASGFLKNWEHKKLKCSKLFLKIIRSLSLDLYNPITVGNLFELLYAKEYFDPEHSTHKTYQVMTRFQEWIRKNKLALQIDSTPLGYRWGKNTELTLYFTKTNQSDLFTNDLQLMLTKLKTTYGTQKFSTESFMDDFKVSRRTANRNLKPLTDAGLLAVFGKGKSTTYQLKT
jgi:hypothetical protein